MKALYKPLAFIAIALYLLSPEALVFAQTPPPTCQLYLNTTSISVGGSVTLSWTSTNATEGAITNVGNVGPSGSKNLLPSSAAYTTYIGSFTGEGGTANCSATVTVSAGGGGSVTSTSDTGTQSATLGSGGGTQNATLQNASANGTQNATLGSSNSSASTQTSSSGGSGNTSATTPADRLVPCGYGIFNAGDTNNTPTDSSSTGCQACSLAQLVQNIINFIIGLSIPVAAALFAWAGVLYFTSAENISQRQKAKDIFKNAFIGFVIIITAWLVINTLLNAIFSQNSSLAGGNWFKIQCSANRPISGNLDTILSQALGTAQVVVSEANTAGNANNSAYSCASGYALTNTDGLVSCVMTDSNGNYVDSQAPTCTNNANPNIDGQCPDANGNIVLPTTTGGSATGASSSLINAVYAQETGSGAVGANVCNAYDACGPMQIQPGTACNAAASADISVPGCSGGSVVDQSQVENYLNTAGLAANQALAGQILGSNLNSSYCNGSTACALAEYNGGVAAVMPSTNCPGQQAYQCTLNSGYQQTRNYVSSICSKTAC